MDDATINRLKREWTGKQVTISPDHPTTTRFRDRVGTVVTINMNGRALVRFADSLDTAWFDLPVEMLRPATSTSQAPPKATAPAGAGQSPTTPSSEEGARSPGVAASSGKPTGKPSKTQSILEMARRQGAPNQSK